MRGWGVLAVLLCAACGETGRTPPASPDCRDPSAALAEADRLAAEGRLAQALDSAQAADRSCSTTATRQAVAARRADLWIDEASRARWDRKSTPAAQEQARKLYRNGWDLRLAGRLDDARKALQRSYQASPHPLTLVQLGLLEGAAGKPAEQRRAYARALATAEASRGARAEPRVAVGHSQTVVAIAYLQGGRALVSLGRDGALKTWDLGTGRVVRSLVAHDAWGRSLAVSTDESLLATSGMDDEVTLWDAARGELLGRRKLGRTTKVAFLPGGGLVTAGNDLALLALPSLEPRWRLRLERASNALAVGPAGIAVGVGREIRLVGEDGAVGRTFPQPGEVSALALSPDGNALAVAAARSVAVVDLGSGRERWRATAARHVVDLAWRPDGSLLAAGQSPGRLELCDARTGRGLRVAAADGLGAAVRFAPDGDSVALAAEAVSIFGAEDASLRRALAAHGEAVTDLAVTVDGALLGWADVGLAEDETRLRRLPSGELTSVPGEVAGVSPDGRQLIMVSDGGDVEVRPTAGGAGQRFHVADDLIDAGFTPQGDALVIVRRHRVELRTPAGEVRWSTAESEPLAGPVRFDTAGKRVALRRMKDIGIWDLAGGALVAHGGAQAPANLISYALHGDLLATGSVEENLLVTDLRGGRELYRRDDHGEDVEALAFTPDGKMLISGGADGRIFLWDPASGGRRHVLTGHSGWMTGGVVILPGGRVLASASSDRTVRLWDLRRAAPLAAVVGTLADPMLVIAEDGAVDGGPGADALVYWQVGDVQLPGFVGWERHHRPGLLRALLDGGR